DNRRPVDFGLRQKLQQELRDGIDWPALAAAWRDGRIKFALSQALLRLREAKADLFRDGDYRATPVKGRHSDKVMAFSRNHGGQSVIVATGRLMAGLTDGGRRWPQGRDWMDTAIDLPAGQVFQNVLRPGETCRDL